MSVSTYALSTLVAAQRFLCKEPAALGTLGTTCNERGEPALVADEPVKFEKQPVEVQGFGNITDCSRGIYGIYIDMLKKKPEDVNM